jgi:predicted ATPase/DNA-binding CsgD family transcriptional regulator
MPESGSANPLPLEVTSFVGRRAERQQIRSLLADARLVTLTGFGGVGKSRLAVRVAADLRRAFPEGVTFVPLAPQADPDLVPQSIVAALGIQGRSTKAVTASLVEYLTGRSMLVVLDNCEHLVDAAAVLCDTLLRTCPDLRIIATSREPLRIHGEAVHPVAPLSVPGPDESSTPLQQFESVNLFVDRARAVVADFSLDEDNREAVAAIVRDLEGIPLAIELAAGRLRAMSATELHQNLTERWDLLSRGSRTAPTRQQTMRACIEWSFDLCTTEEQAHWAALSVFADGFELDAARVVCRPLGGDVDDLVQSLVEKSIIIAEPNARRTRFRMLPPIRHRGVVQLTETGELDDARRRHRDWLVEYSRAAKREWMGPRQVDFIHRLRQEMGNYQAGLEYCLDQPGELEPGLEMGANLLEFGLADGLFREGRLWFNRLLERHHESNEVRALGLRTACWWAAMQGDLEDAARLLEEGRLIATRLGGHLEALFLQTAAYLAMFTGDLDGAARRFVEAITALGEHGDASQVAHSHALAALNHVFRGDPDAALAAHEACRQLTEPVGESWYLSYSLWIAGLAHWDRGDLPAAESAEKESLRIKRDTADRLGISVSLEALAWMCAETHPERAAHLLGAAQSQFEEIQTSTEALAGLHVRHVTCVDQVRTALGTRYPTLFAEGQALAPLESIDLALEEAAPRRRGRKTTRTPRASATGLTKRELQIAELVATGLSNKEIASTLVISKRTAETHVEHILIKLGFTNRNQIAAWVGDHADVRDAPAT